MATATEVPTIYIIGETAGKIYKSLQSKKDQTATELKKTTKVRDTAILQQGIGWLAREDKLNFKKTNGKGELRISLK